ncbi:MAG: alpha/beta fold hydrolase [Pseudomonadota bacterium]
MRYLLLLILSFAPFTASALCSPDAPCEVEDGEYFLSLPDGWETAETLPAILFYHGHNSSANSTLKSAGLRDSFVKRGWVLIAPNGAKRPNGIRAWPARPGHGGGRDDVAFTLAVLEDAKARLPLDVDRIVVSGFSAGGSMAWMMGCYEGDRFAAVISVAGALRHPNPDACPEMAPRALHIHGFGDKQVPFEGRGIRDWHQGDVSDTFDLFRSANGCRSNPHAISIGERFRQRLWRCVDGDLTYLEHNGGHGLPRGWTERAHAWVTNGDIILD